MQNNMMLMLLVSATLMTGLNSVPCPGTQKFHTEIHNNTCYLISFKYTTFKQSYEFCRNLGGYLTDMEENRSLFFKGLAENNNLYDNVFWTGLLWASSLGAPVWDSGRTYTLKDTFSGFNIGGCAMYTPRTATWEWVDCSSEINFICSLASYAVASRHQDNCDQVCLRIKSKDNVKTTPLARETFPDVFITIDYTLPEKAWTTNTPEESDEFINMSSKNCVCIGKRNFNSSTITSPAYTNKSLLLMPSFDPPVWDSVHLTLGLIMAASVVINIIQGVVNYRNVRKHRHLVTEKLTAIAFVDNLNVDNHPMSGLYSENGDAPENKYEQITPRPQQDVYNNEGLPEMVYYNIDQAQYETIEMS